MPKVPDERPNSPDQTRVAIWVMGLVGLMALLAACTNAGPGDPGPRRAATASTTAPDLAASVGSTGSTSEVRSDVQPPACRPVPTPASGIGLRIKFALTHPVSLGGPLQHVTVSIENTTNRAVELNRFHEYLDIYLVRSDGAPVTLTGGDAMIIRAPIVVMPHKTVRVDAAVELDPCSGTTTSPPPGRYGAVLGVDVEGHRSMVASTAVPATLVE